MKRYGIRITLPPGDPFRAAHLLGDDWASHRWFDTAGRGALLARHDLRGPVLDEAAPFAAGGGWWGKSTWPPRLIV